MRGLFVFDDNQQLLYSKLDKQLKRVLLKKQSEYQSSSINDTCDSITTAYVFLPLLVCYQSIKCIKFDRYVSIRNCNISFHFSEFPDDPRLLVIAVGAGNEPADEMRVMLHHFINILQFALGPLAASMSHPIVQSQVDLLNFSLRDIFPAERGDEQDQTEQEFLQHRLQCVDAGALCKVEPWLGNKAASFSSLAWIGGQLLAFLRCEMCILVRNGMLLGSFHGGSGTRTSSDKANPAHLITLIRTATKFGNAKTGGQSCYSCYTVACRMESSSSASVFSDVFRIDLSDGLYLICVTPSTHSDLMSDLAAIINMAEKLDQLRYERGLLLSHSSSSRANKLGLYYEYWLNRIDSHAQSLCVNLDDRLIFMQGAKQRKAVEAFRDLHRTLRDHIHRKTRKPDVARVGEDSEETLTVRGVRQLATRLLLDTFNAAREEAGGYKLEKLERCWRNLTYSTSYTPVITNLVHSCSIQPDQGPPASRYVLDTLAYLALFPDRRILLSNGFIGHDTHDRHQLVFLCTAIADMLHDKSRSNLAFKMIWPKAGEHLLYCMASRKTDKRNETSGGLLSKLATVWNGRTSEVEEDSMKEPMVMVCLYEAFINEDLACRESRQLAVHLYDLVTAENCSL